VPIDAVIFDCDGLLVDTETAWTHAERVFYGRRGVEFSLAHKHELVGTAGAIARATMERHLGLEPGALDGAIDEMHELVLDQIARGAPAMPGAHELVGELRAAGTPVGVASNSPHLLLDPSLEGAGFDGLFGAVVSADDVPAGKPAPDVYLDACRRLGADPERSVALEDSPTGAAAARAAGLLVVGVPSLPGVELAAASLIVSSLRAPEVRDSVGLRLAA
jgi:HAD superfamily hydrolase (TIGR01509 family)